MIALGIPIFPLYKNFNYDMMRRVKFRIYHTNSSFMLLENREKRIEPRCPGIPILPGKMHVVRDPDSRLIGGTGTGSVLRPSSIAGTEGTEECER
jgi:hypothetical protein